MPFRTSSAVITACLVLGVAQGAEGTGHETPPGAARATTTRLRQVVDDYYSAGQFSGVVLVATADQVVVREAWGHADWAWCVPNTPETRFQIGSLTKQFTAAVVLRLAQAGRLDLRRPVGEYLPRTRLPNAQRITLHQLLSHSAGVPDPSTAEDFLTMIRQPMPTAERLDRLCSDAPLFEPGKSWSYSNCGYEVIGAVVESVTGRPFRESLEELLRDHGLEGSGYTDHRTLVPWLANGYIFEDEQWKRMPHYDWTNSVASGSLYSTVDDLWRWNRGLFSGSIVEPSSLRTMIEPVANGYGYGLYLGWGSVEQIDELLSSVRTHVPSPMSRDLHVISHSGDLAGFHSLMVYLRNHDQVVIVLDNHDLTGIYDHRRLSHLGADLVRVLVGRSAHGPQAAYGPANVPANIGFPCETPDDRGSGSAELPAH